MVFVTIFSVKAKGMLDVFVFVQENRSLSDKLNGQT